MLIDLGPPGVESHQAACRMRPAEPPGLGLPVAALAGDRGATGAKLLLQCELPRGVHGARALDGDGAARRLLGALQPRMPDADDIASGRQVFKPDLDVGASLSEVLCLGDVAVGTDPVLV